MEVTDLPAVNAGLNALATCFLFAGWWAIRRRKITLHRNLMVAALASSAAFLGCYLYYHAHVGSVPYQGTGILRVIYFSVLIPHIILAAVMVPFILAGVYFALRAKFELHRRIMRWTWPVWMYVSITGVIVYVMLYRL